MTIAEQQAKIAEYEARVNVLKALLAEAETRLAFFRNAEIVVQRRLPAARYASWPPTPDPPQPQDTCTVAEVLADVKDDTLTDAELKLDHRSGSGENSAKCKEQFVEWLNNHGVPGDWHKTVDMGNDLNAWPRFGKQVVDAVIEQLVTESVVEVERNPWSNCPRKIRLKQQEAVY